MVFLDMQTNQIPLEIAISTIWGKKIERDISTHGGLSPEAYTLKAEKKRLRESLAEIEKVKKKREEKKAIEKARQEEESALLERESALPAVWEKEEKEFLFDQSKIRSDIRFREGRTKPIDVLIKHLINPLDISEVFKGLSVKEMEALRDDIQLHLGLDRATPIHTQYWEALLVVCDWELLEARKKDALDRARVGGERRHPELLVENRGMHSSIEADVKSLLVGKSYAELEALQHQIESGMRSGSAKVVEYWEALLKRLHVFKAKACLKEIHAKMLTKHSQPMQVADGDRECRQRPKEEYTDDDDDDKVLSPGSFSPCLFDDDDDEAEAIDPEEDKAILERKRSAVLQERRLRELIASRPTPAEGKFKLRKPKYLNHVHTGYEWNKYNQTHYDHDNPPSKMVQGYKFNVFYPDLFDKREAPTYIIEKDGDSTETCIIRFHGGPPYEDIAFWIVNKDWELSPKKGFKCTFERGTLHLHFNFKRDRYRR